MFSRIAVATFVLLSLGFSADALALATPTPTPVPVLAVTVREVCNTNGVLNLRGGPSKNARVIDTLPDEYDLVVLGSSLTGSWLKVRDEGGRTGWVARQFTCADDGKDVAVGPWRDPAPGACVSSPFGPRNRPCGVCSKNHRGIDLAVCNSAIGAAASGRVMTAKYDRHGGNYVAIDHGAGLVTYYMHLKSSHVTPGQTVTAGTKVGIAGRTGTATTGCHLHFEVRRNGRSVDPQSFLPRPLPKTAALPMG